MCASHMHRIGKGGISVAFGCLFFPLSIGGFECAITFQIVVLFVWLLRFRNASFECRSKVTHRIFRQINSMHTQKPHTFPGNRSPIKSSTKKVLPDDYIRVSNIILDQDIKLSDIFFLVFLSRLNSLCEDEFLSIENDFSCGSERKKLYKLHYADDWHRIKRKRSTNLKSTGSLI